MDNEMLMMIAIAVGGIILLVVLGRLLKRHRIFRAVAMGLIIISIVTGALFYVYNNEMMFSSEAKYYVYGRVSFASPSTWKIKFKSIRTNLLSGGTDTVIAKVKTRTEIIDENNDNQKITLRDIKEGDYIQIFCVESKANGEEITAIKVIKKKID